MTSNKIRINHYAELFCVFYTKLYESAEYLEFLQHKGELPFTMADKLLKMKKKVKLHFTYLVLSF